MQVKIANYPNNEHVGLWSSVTDPADEYGTQVEVDLPSEIVKEWSAVRARLIELESYIGEKAEPALEKQQRESRERFQRELEEQQRRNAETLAEEQRRYEAIQDRLEREGCPIPRVPTPDFQKLHRSKFQDYLNDMEAVLKKYGIRG